MVGICNHIRRSLERLDERIVPYVLSGNRWTNTNVSASFMPNGTTTDSGAPSNLIAMLNNVAPTATWQREFARALQSWANVSSLNFRFVSDNGAAHYTAGSAQGDSRFGDIRFGGYATTNWVGAASYPSTAPASGNVFLNTSMSWRIGAATDVFPIVLHETGHAVGLAHSTQWPSVMAPSISGVYSGLYPDDIAGIQAIYGARQNDAYDAAAANNSLTSATTLSLDMTGALAVAADLTTLADLDYFRVTAPAGSNGSLTVSTDARDLSLLSPKISVYGAAGNLLGTASATTYGSVATLTLNGLNGGQTYYLVADGATSDAFGMGAYGLRAQFSVAAVNNNPTVTTSAGTTAALEQITVPIDGGVLVADADNATLASATVSIAGGFQSGEDVLAFTNTGAAAMGNIAVTGNAGGVMTLTSAGATATLTQWQTALRAVTYTDTSDAPNTSNRTISFVVNDGANSSAAAARAVSVAAVNDNPTVTTSAGTTAAMEQIAVAIDGGLTVADADSTTLASATVSITGGFQSGEDVLAFTNTGAAAMGNVAVTGNAGGVMTLTSAGATATLAQWQTALRAVTYTDTSDAPNTSNRTISFVVNDGANSSAAAARTVSVAAVNDAPLLTPPGNDFTTITEDQLASAGDLVLALITGRVSDVDLGASSGIAVIATSQTGGGTWEFSTNGGSTWTSVGTVSATSGLLLRSQDRMRLVPDGSHGGTGSVTFRAWDQTSGTFGTTANPGAGGGTSAFSTTTATSSITVTEVAEATITSLTIGDGTAQRSRIDRMELNFSEAINPGTLGAGAFSLTRTGPTGAPIAISINVAWSNGNTRATLTFTGAGVEVDNSPGATGGSLVDGNYLLAVNGNQIFTSAANQPIDVDDDGLIGGTRTQTFFRLFGDRDGNRQVDNIDFFFFRSALGSSVGQANYVAAFDFNGDGLITNVDFFQFRLRLGQPPLPFTP